MKTLTLRTAAALTVTAGAVLLTSQTASALTWNWKYNGTGIDASGTFTTTDTANAEGFYLIQAITGQRNGDPIVSLLNPGTGIPGNEPFLGDNLLRLNGPQLTKNGFGFSTLSGKFANPFFASFLNPPAYLEVYSAPPFLTGSTNLGAEDSELPIAFSATPVPTPALLPGLIGMGWVGLRRKRQAA